MTRFLIKRNIGLWKQFAIALIACVIQLTMVSTATIAGNWFSDHIDLRYIGYWVAFVCGVIVRERVPIGELHFTSTKIALVFFILAITINQISYPSGPASSYIIHDICLIIICIAISVLTPLLIRFGHQVPKLLGKPISVIGTYSLYVYLSHPILIRLFLN